MEGACSTHGILRNVWKILLGKPEEERQLGRSSCRLQDNIKLCVTGWDSVGGIHLVHRYQ
jgi:hypothetical protein